MSTRRAAGIALLVGGIILIAYGLQASQSLASEMSETFTGSPTDRAIWMTVGGAVTAVLGVLLALKSGE